MEPISVNAILGNPDLLDAIKKHLKTPKKTQRIKITDEMTNIAKAYSVNKTVFSRCAREAWDAANPGGAPKRVYKDGAYQLFLKVRLLMVF